MIDFCGKQYDDSHGSAFDRGSADSYYQRPKTPHMFLKGTYIKSMLNEGTKEYEDYMAGYDYNEFLGVKKEYE